MFKIEGKFCSKTLNPENIALILREEMTKQLNSGVGLDINELARQLLNQLYSRRIIREYVQQAGDTNYDG